MKVKLKFYVFPCGLDKSPLTSHGEKDASNSKERLDRWRAQWPDMNLAIATGPSDLIAVDEDHYKKIFIPGSVEAACGVKELPDTISWRTGSGGLIRIYRRNGEKVASRNGVLPGVDVKASTGYVLCPPSRNVNGEYTWINPPKTTVIADAPREMLEWLASIDGKRRNIPMRGEGDTEEAYLTSGTGRWETVRSLGGMLRRKGVGEKALFEMLQSFVQHHCEYDDTLRDSELERLSRWLASNPPANPFRDDGAPVTVTLPDGSSLEMEMIDPPSDKAKMTNDDVLREHFKERSKAFVLKKE